MSCIEHSGASDTYLKVRGKWAHRVALERKLGRKLEPNEVTRHTCDNKRCINPDHLIVGTQGDNIRDAFERGLMPLGEARTHAKLTEELVRYVRSVYVPRSKVFGTRALARALNVSQWSISHAIRHITWRHVKCLN